MVTVYTLPEDMLWQVIHNLRENESASIHKLDLLAQNLVNFEDNLISSREQSFCR